MRLTAYAQAVDPAKLQLWVGLFDTETPTAPAFRINRVDLKPVAPVVALQPIRDRRVGAGGLPCNHHAIYAFALADFGIDADAAAGAARQVLVEVTAGDARYEFVTWTLPRAIPQAMEGSFNVLLCSCYYQPEDRQGLLGALVAQIKLTPHLTVMAGDQVYLDLPLLEDLPEDEPALSQTLGQKYMRNWGSTQLNIPGLESVLTCAPVVSVPDDHEFWNNYPFRQKQLPNLWRTAVRDRWADAAQALYEDYQLAGDPATAGATRLDVAPIRMLFLDMRCRRDALFRQLMNDTALNALTTWADDLIRDTVQGRPQIGLLSSGEALFIEPPTASSKQVDVDAEMGNYAQFELIVQQLERLADRGIPILYLTGDVHWGRVASALDRRGGTGASNFYEIIASPSRLIRTPLLDTAREASNHLKGVFGHAETWPRHGEPEDLESKTFGSHHRFDLKSEFCQRGDQVAVLSFTRAGAGVDFEVTYYPIHPDKAVARSRSSGKFELRPRQKA